MEKQRTYFVIDMKSFFASVECAELNLDAMEARLVVADESRTDKTICLAVSPALKKLGVKNRCRLFEIPKNLDFIIVPPRMKKYISYAAEIYGIYLKYISKDDIHVYSIDECIIDATDYLSLYKLSAVHFAKLLTKEILEKVKIPASVGIGTNMYLAKIALDITAKNSKDRIGFLDEEKFKKELWHHRPLTDFWQISKGISSRLSHYGVFDMQGITQIKEETLYKEFGVNAEIIIDHAYGRESCLMSDIKAYKGKSHSISSSQILPCGYSFNSAKLILKEMIQEGCYRLYQESCVASRVNVFIGYDGEQTLIHGGKTFGVNSYLNSTILPFALEVYDEIVDKFKAVRRVGFSFSGLLPVKYENYDLFTDVKKVEKEKSLVKSVIEIKEKFGKNAILKARDYVKGATAKERNEQVGGHKGGES
ncbi:MAG: DNA repair protein [Clostridia bacterium]|nr:DNA repair protein [Clostridia bacterium]